MESPKAVPITSTEAIYPHGRPWKFLDLLRGADAHFRTWTLIAVASAWLPVAVLSATRGRAAFLSFLTDYASQSRLLIILPMLILGLPNLYRRHAMVARHLEGFVPETQITAFQANWNSFEKLRQSTLSKIMIVLLVYALAIWLIEYVDPHGVEVLSWLRGGSVGHLWLSPAGMWACFVSFPMGIFLLLLWLWRQLIWTRFLQSSIHLDLRLIAAHPDRVGGIGFVAYALRALHPLSFCLGVGLAGAVANRVFHAGAKLTSFSHLAAVLLGAVLLICIMPYLVFTPALLKLRRTGLFRYGSLARDAGGLFEKEWLDRPHNLDQSFMTRPDFAAVKNLYGVADNVNDIKTLAFDRIDITGMVVTAFIPAIPLLIGSVPLDTVAKALIKIMF